MVVPTCNLSIQEAEAQRKRWQVPHSLEQLVRSWVNNNSNNNSSPPPEKSKQIRDEKGNLSKIKVTYGHYVSLLPGSFLPWLRLCLFLRQCPLLPRLASASSAPPEQRPSASGAATLTGCDLLLYHVYFLVEDPVTTTSDLSASVSACASVQPWRSQDGF